MNMGGRPYSENYLEHRRIVGEKQAERVRVRKVKKELVKLFTEIFCGFGGMEKRVRGPLLTDSLVRKENGDVGRDKQEAKAGSRKQAESGNTQAV